MASAFLLFMGLTFCAAGCSNAVTSDMGSTDTAGGA